MVFKRLTALAAVLLILLTMPAALAAGISGSELAGTMPYLLTSTSDKNARCTECTMGDAVADAACRYLNADIAIVCGGDLIANLPAGDLTWDELQSAFAGERKLATVSVSVRQLREILEAGVAHVRLDEKERIDVAASLYDGFPQISGFTFRYDVCMPEGQPRLYAISVNGEELDMDDDTTMLTLAATQFMLEGGYGLPSVEGYMPSDLTLADVTARYMNDGMSEYAKPDGRIRAMGASEGFLSGGSIAVIVILIIAMTLLERKGSRRRMSDYGYYQR